MHLQMSPQETKEEMLQVKFSSTGFVDQDGDTGSVNHANSAAKHADHASLPSQPFVCFSLTRTRFPLPAFKICGGLARCRVERGSLCPLLLGPDGGMRFPRSTRKAFDSFVANVELVAALRASSRDTEGGCGLAEDAPMVMRRRRRANTSLVENARGWTGLVAMSWVVVAPYGDLKPFAGGDKHVGGGDLNTRREIDFDKLRTRF
ncbi:hypothetical protein BHE74_00053878 [Ensete ventricosum]|nr:hypothetical protein BHE74_00053878 [Ensete ventricosum]